MQRKTVILALAFCTVATAAFAQTGTPGERLIPGVNTSAPQGGTTTGAAPVGHRQPTAASVPAPVRQDERATERAQGQAVDPLGPVPSICKGC